MTEVAELKGALAQDAFIINYGAHGYAKFVIDEASLTMFETKLHQVEDRLTRNQIYGILYDMIKSGHISGSRVMHIMSNNLKQETAEEVLATQLSQYVPSIIGKYLPTETYDAVNSKMFESCREILASGRFVAESTQQMLVSSMISFVQDETLREILVDWYFNDRITDSEGVEIANLKLTLK